jgi:hypothetical protein
VSGQGQRVGERFGLPSGVRLTYPGALGTFIETGDENN